MTLQLHFCSMCLWLLSLLATFVAVEGGDTCQQGFLYKERGIPTMTNLPNSEVCQQACSKNKYCSHFSYDLGDCWFLKAASGLKEKATAISGDKYCASSKDFMLDTETPEEKVRRIHEMIANLAHYVEENSQDVNAVKNAGHVKWSSQNGFLKEEGHDNLAKMLNSASMIFANAGGVSAYAGEIPTREDLDWLLTHTTGQEAVTEEIPPEERLPVGGDTPCNNLRGCGAAQGKSFGVGAPWTNAEVKYCLDPQLHLRAKEAALCGIRMISNALPGIRFTNVGSSGSSCSSNPAVFVTSSQSGCWANIGMARSNFFGFGGGQKLNLMTPGCDDCGTATHEWLHAMGMAHEQSRPDRDQYIVISWQNIKSGMDSQFAIDRSADVHRPYDIRSIMHYGSTAFTNNGRPTISVKAQGYALYTTNPSEYRRYRPGQRMAMSEQDIEQLADLYDCVTPNNCMSQIGPSGPDARAVTVNPGPGGNMNGGGVQVITPFNMNLSSDQISFFVMFLVGGTVICCALSCVMSGMGMGTKTQPYRYVR